MDTEPNMNRPCVGFLPIWNRAKLPLEDDYERGLGLIQGLDADIVATAPAWSQPEVLDRLEELQAQSIDLLVVYVLNGMSSYQQTLAGARSTVPVALWALPTSYSFPSAANAVGVLRERDRRVRMVYSDGDPAVVIPQLEVMARAAFALHELQRSRIGTLGDLFPNLPGAHYHPDTLMDLLGPQVVHIRLSELHAVHGAIRPDDPSVEEEMGRFRARYEVQVGDQMLARAVRFHRSLQQIAERQRLTAIAMECHTELTPLYGINPCIGFAGEACPFLIGCEGDVVMAVNLLMLRYLTGQEGYLGDIYSLKDGVITLVHCGGDWRLARGGRVAIVEQMAPETVGLATRMAICLPQLPSGPVTVTRLHGPRCDRLDVATGTVLESNTEQRLAVRVQLDSPQRFLEKVSGNHYALVYGDARPHLRVLADWLNLQLTEI
jgi:L-fucose isomerase-like protein